METDGRLFLTVPSDLPSGLRRTKKLMTPNWGNSWIWGEVWSKGLFLKSLQIFFFFNNVLTCFFSNQSAAKKTSLEDEIKRYQTLLTSATRRSHTAQVTSSSSSSSCWCSDPILTIKKTFKKRWKWFTGQEHVFVFNVLVVLLQLFLLESSRDQKLNGLHRELADNKTLLSKLDEVIHRWEERGSKLWFEENSNYDRHKVKMNRNKKAATAACQFMLKVKFWNQILPKKTKKHFKDFTI